MAAEVRPRGSGEGVVQGRSSGDDTGKMTKAGGGRGGDRATGQRSRRAGRCPAG